MSKCLLTFFLILLCHAHGLAQGSSQDTTITTSNHSSNSFTSIFYGDPGRSALYALIIPSAGQFYNKRYWKVPIALAVEYWAIRNLIMSISNVSRISECRRSYLEADPIPSDACIRTTSQSIISEDEVFEEWNDARGNKETAWLIMGGAHLLTIVEAFVDRHLINFDTTEDLSLHNLPAPHIVKDISLNTPQFNLLTLRIPLNKKEYSIR